MLENSPLLLLPWAAEQQRACDRSRPVRKIVDPATGEVRGFACWHAGPGRSWFSWLARPALDIFSQEGDDASLLFTLYCPWFFTRAWEVYDAEEHLVGTLRGNLALDRLGRILATVEGASDGRSLRFLTQYGYEPTALMRADTGFRLTFASDLTGDPFARMILLGAGLALTNAHQAEMK